MNLSNRRTNTINNIFNNWKKFPRKIFISHQVSSFVAYCKEIDSCNKSSGTLKKREEKKDIYTRDDIASHTKCLKIEFQVYPWGGTTTSACVSRFLVFYIKYVVKIVSTIEYCLNKSSCLSWNKRWSIIWISVVAFWKRLSKIRLTCCALQRY